MTLGAVDSLPPLWVRLARLAVELDDLAQELAAEPLTEADEDLLAAPVAHLTLAVETILETDYELAKWGVAPWPPVVAKERIAA